MSNTTTVTPIKNPGTYEVSSSAKIAFFVFIALGVIAFALGLNVDAKRTWASFLLNHFYFMSLGLGGAFFAAIQWITGSMWSAPVRRLSESFTAYLPFVFVTFIILCFGVPHLYLWSHAEHVQGDLVLEGKSGYLSLGFFTIRNLLAIGIWLFFSYRMVQNSILQDTSKSFELNLKNRVLAPAFLALFAITFTMASFDQLMSLDPHWFSTMFGVYCFAGLVYANFALTCLMALYMRSKGKLDQIVNLNHFHDLGQFMFAFTVFWAYIGFSQFMLIWYANLPEETGYFIKRLSGDWRTVSLVLFAAKFLVPFFCLIARSAKRNPRILGFVAVFMLIAQWFDVMWMVQPEFFKDGPKFGLSEIGVTLGFIGVFGLLVSRFLGKYNIVAIGDPRLEEAVFHHHV
jgi:hypothetical protein